MGTRFQFTLKRRQTSIDLIKSGLGNFVKFIFVDSQVGLPQLRVPDFPIETDANDDDFIDKFGVQRQSFRDSDSALIVNLARFSLRIKQPSKRLDISGAGGGTTCSLGQLIQ